MKLYLSQQPKGRVHGFEDENLFSLNVDVFLLVWFLVPTYEGICWAWELGWLVAALVSLLAVACPGTCWGPGSVLSVPHFPSSLEGFWLSQEIRGALCYSAAPL